jgi:hypothetical protein
MAICRCIETGVYDITSLEGISEALVKDADEMRKFASDAIADKEKTIINCEIEVAKARREAAIAVANSDQPTIDALRAQVSVLQEQNRMLIVQSNLRGVRVPTQAIAAQQIPVSVALDRALAQNGSVVTTTVPGTVERKIDHNRTGYEDIEID